MAVLGNIEVRPIAGEELQTAALVAARGTRDNPLHVAAIGEDPERPWRDSFRFNCHGRPWNGRRQVCVVYSRDASGSQVREEILLRNSRKNRELIRLLGVMNPTAKIEPAVLRQP